ncbi:DNA-binding response regulator [Paenibacillus agaridevorans]|uniref:DNA-binding response regulator n=1 Tax=Paenibacillus agaridevorans TaxID=171404 RepID=A0A2R5EK12_9BACL|nr:response regulator [Paenibacillus agaridevorans]GBG06956.1 DNA-binding response regulator [Paenibacillus agaridevorans]
MYKVLIVDDEAMIREDLKDFVQWEAAGFTEVRLAASGQTALLAASETKFDLVLADINMPRMNGLVMIRSLRESGYKGHIVVITAYGEFEYAKTAITLGVKEYVLKPIDFREMNVIVRRIADQLREETETVRSQQYAVEAKASAAELLEATALQRRERAEAAIGALFAARERLRQPLPVVLSVLQQTIVQAEAQLNGYNPSYYATKQPLFLELLQRQSACETEQDVRQLFRQLAAHLIDCYEAAGTVEGGAFSQLKPLIKAHLGEEISLEWLAQRVHISANYLSVVFKKETGENFNEFVMRERMMTARELLRNKEHRIVDIGERVGYANYRSFSRAFKNFFGLSPSEFREQQGSR